MIVNYNDFIYERSSLTKLGVPKEAMQMLQNEYEIQYNANWIKIQSKKDFILELKKSEIALYIQITLKFIKIIMNINNEYFVERYKLNDDGFGGTYEKKERETSSITQLSTIPLNEGLLYKLDGDFKYKPKKERLVQKELNKLDRTTSDFKFYVLKNFNNLIRKIYGARHKEVIKKICDNLAKIGNDNKSDDIFNFLNDNKELAKMAKEYEMAKEDNDILRLTILDKKYNSLTNLDEFILNFEDLYSEEFNWRLNIKDMIDTFGLMRIETAFLYYLFTGKIKKLNIDLNR
jgi:hypothetical protein